MPPRDTFPQPPLGMDIGYDAGAMIMVRCDNPEQHLVVHEHVGATSRADVPHSGGAVLAVTRG